MDYLPFITTPQEGLPKYLISTTDVDMEYDKENYNRKTTRKNITPNPNCQRFCDILLKGFKEATPDNLK